MRTLAVSGLQSTLSFWWLDFDSELLFVKLELQNPVARAGVTALKWANYYSLTKTLTLDADVSNSHPEFRDNPIDSSIGRPIGLEIPGAIDTVQLRR